MNAHLNVYSYGFPPQYGTGYAFTWSDEVESVKVSKQLEQYIAGVNPKVNAHDVAKLLTVAAHRHDLDPLLLACIARYESTMRTAARGLAGELGLLQCHPCHKRRMADMGLSFGNEADRLDFCGHMIRERLDDGADLYTALRPWSVRRKAWAEYKRVSK